MIRSMTGFGEASSHEDGVHYFLEVRSLNNKYFKASIRLPEDLQALEPELESALRRRLTRGSIVVSVKCSDASANAALDINTGALSRYIEQLKKAPDFAEGRVGIDLGALLTLPGVLVAPANEEVRLERGRAQLGPLLEQACDHLVSMREREGAMLVDDLLKHHAVIAERLAIIAERAPDIVREYERRLHSRIQTLLQDVNYHVETVDIVREVGVFAEKSDISEEISRLNAHLDQFKALITNKAEDRPVGRTLDFIAQEMLREANTIASKSGDAEISRSTVEIKAAIDRIKEQVQNIE